MNLDYIAIFEIILMIVGLSFIFSLLLFIRISMKYIEKQMFEEGIEPPAWDRRGMGWRISMYNMVIIRGKPAKVSLVDDEAILRHARPLDRVLAYSTFISLVLMMLVGAIAKWGLELEP